MLYFVNIFRLRCAFATALSADLLPTSNPTDFPELRQLDTRQLTSMYQLILC